MAEPDEVSLRTDGWSEYQIWDSLTTDVEISFIKITRNFADSCILAKSSQRRQFTVLQNMTELGILPTQLIWLLLFASYLHVEKTFILCILYWTSAKQRLRCGYTSAIFCLYKVICVDWVGNFIKFEPSKFGY